MSGEVVQMKGQVSTTPPPKVTVADIQNAVRQAIEGTVKQAVQEAVDNSTMELKYELQHVKNELLDQREMLSGHYRLVDERLRELNKPKPTLMDRLRKSLSLEHKK